MCDGGSVYWKSIDDCFAATFFFGRGRGHRGGCKSVALPQISPVDLTAPGGFNLCDYAASRPGFLATLDVGAGFSLLARSST